jgi:hypothetical protein
VFKIISSLLRKQFLCFMAAMLNFSSVYCSLCHLFRLSPSLSSSKSLRAQARAISNPFSQHLPLPSTGYKIRLLCTPFSSVPKDANRFLHVLPCILTGPALPSASNSTCILSLPRVFCMLSPPSAQPPQPLSLLFHSDLPSVAAKTPLRHQS